MCVFTLTRRSHDWYMWQNLCHLKVLAKSWERWIVKISAIFPFPTDCRQMWQKWKKSPTLIKSRLLPFPRLVCTWQAHKWCVCTISIFRCVESPSIRIMGTRSQWQGKYLSSVTEYEPSGLKRGSAVARLLELRVRIQPGARMSVSCECCVLLGRGLCEGPIPYPEESYRLRCIIVCDL
jgi:hypothetical protein